MAAPIPGSLLTQARQPQDDKYWVDTYANLEVGLVFDGLHRWTKDTQIEYVRRNGVWEVDGKEDIDSTLTRANDQLSVTYPLSVDQLDSLVYATPLNANNPVLSRSDSPYRWIGDKANENLGWGIQQQALPSGSTKNRIGMWCSGNILGANFYHNKIGDNFLFNNIGVGFQENNTDSYFTYNTVGVNLTYSRFGSYCTRNIIGNNCSNLIFETGCAYVTIGSNCSYLTIIGCNNIVIPPNSKNQVYINNILVSFKPITENQYGMYKHPAFNSQNDLNAWLLTNRCCGDINETVSVDDVQGESDSNTSNSQFNNQFNSQHA